MQFQRSNSLQAFHQTSESLEVFVAVRTALVFKILIHERNCSAQISNFVQDRGGGDPTASGQLAQAAFFSLAHFLGRINNDCGKSDMVPSLVRGKPSVRYKDLPILSCTLTLRSRMKLLG